MRWTCRCGGVTARVDVAQGTRAVCYCPSCRDFAKRLGASDRLDTAGGSDLFQVAPEAVTIESGGDRLAWLRLTERGPLRWFTTCCNTPLANTLPTRAIPFLTLQSAGFEAAEALPPVAARVHRRYATARVPDDGDGVWRLYREFAVRALRSRLTGGWRKNPLFDADGTPVGAEATPT